MNDSVLCLVSRSDFKLTELAVDFIISKAKNCSKVIYYSLAKSIQELKKMHLSLAFPNIEIDDTPGIYIEDIFEHLNEISMYDEKIYCVIDQFPMLRTRKKVESRIAESEYIYFQICQYAKASRVKFILTVPVSKYSAKGQTIVDELRCYGTKGMFKNLIVDITDNLKKYMGDIVKTGYVESDMERSKTQEPLIQESQNGLTINSDWNGIVNIVLQDGTEIQVSGSDYVSVIVRNENQTK